jgi:Spy/CpxP family protein refolding chaperone
MKKSRIAIAALALAGTVGAMAARAQVTTAPAIRAKIKQPKTQLIWFKGEVLHADQRSIIVRDPQDPRFVRTFTYSPRVQEKMDRILENGGYQYGDRVKIQYQAGQAGSNPDVALDIKGRPSKPL